jgi:methionyl-tRNA formyltransferase
MGTAEIACPSLRELLSSADFSVVAVVTQPDKPSGRGLKETAPAVKALALEKNLRVLQPIRARDEAFINELKILSPDLIVVMAYGQILPETILSLPKFGCVNVHTSLLPKYRGAAPIQWAIANGETETGVTIMKMDAGMDTGPILNQRATPISAEDNAQALHDRLGELGAKLLVETIPDYVSGKIQPRPQPEGATHAPKIKKEDGKLDWSLPAQTLWNRIRGFTPWPGAFTFLNEDEKRETLKIWKAEPINENNPQPGAVLRADKHGIAVACAKGALLIHELQLAGGRRMSAGDFLLGHPLTPGTKLG